jgi:membrane-associated phospholipid phosphatase
MAGDGSGRGGDNSGGGMRLRLPLAERPKWAFAVVVGGTVLVVASALVADSGTVGPAERAVFEAVNGLPDALRWPMWVFQLLGLVGLPLVVALGAAVFRRWRLVFVCVALVPLKLYVEKGVLKQLVHRERPGRTEVDPILRDVPSAGVSYPSGHAIVAFALATVLTPYLGPRWRIVVWALAGLNGVARVYLGAHNPLDIVGGAGAGLILGGLLTWIVGTTPSRHRPPPA